MRNNKEFLREISYDLLEKKGLADNSEYCERLETELGLICDNDLEDYFLNNSYIISTLKNKGFFFGPSRGSSAGSLLAYLLKITTVDPIRYGLLFSRFLNKGRVENNAMPDIDIDIQKSRRKEAIEIIKDMYGHDKVFSVVNFNTFQVKNTIKDIARSLKIDYNKVNNLTKKLDHKTTLEDLKDNDEIQQFFTEYPDVERFLNLLNGRIRNYGKHAGAVVLLPNHIQEYMGTVYSKKEILTAWDKTIEDEGFLKLDLLGLNTLDIIENTLRITEAKLPKEFDDPKVFETINKSPLGIFQLEKGSGLDLLKRMSINSFEDLYNSLALIRPGSQDTGDTDKYIKIKNGEAEVKYDHEDLKPILGNTNGLILFQEQQQEITKVFGGFSDAESDDIRRAIGKKKMDLMYSYKDIFLKQGKGYNEQLLKTLWDKIEAAGNYSFNKSHSVGYSIISYYTAWLKTYYPAEFLISMANFSDKDKRIKVFNELKQLNKTIHLPHINLSKKEISKINGEVYLGLSLIDGLGDKALDDIISKQPFKDYDDFITRKDSRKVNKRVVTALIEAGALDCWGERDKLYSKINEIEYKKWSDQEKLFREYKRIRVSPNQNLIDYYDDFESDIKFTSISQLNQIKQDNDIYIKALISDYTAKDNFGFLNISDGEDSLSLLVTKKQESKYFELMNEVGKPVILKLHVKYSKLHMNFLIDLQKPENHKREWDYINKKYIGDMKLFNKKNPNINWGTVYSVYDFVSKKGNRCISYNIRMLDRELSGKLTCKGAPDNLEDGDIIGFYPSGDTFINIEEIL